MKETMRNQLKQVKAAIHHYLPNNPNSWIGDGIDHINIFRSGETALGRCLNLDFARRFNNPTLGHFRSINSAWFYLRAQNRDESIRDMNGSALKKYVNSIGGAKELIPNFQALILHIAYLRIKGNKEFTNLILGTTLPFDCYQPNANGLATRFAHSSWFAEGHDEIRSAIRENREPDFTFAMDRRTVTENVYLGAMAILKPKHSEEEIAAAKLKVEEEKKIAEAEEAKAKELLKAKQRQAQKEAAAAAKVTEAVEAVAEAKKVVIADLDATEPGLPKEEAPVEIKELSEEDLDKAMETIAESVKQQAAEQVDAIYPNDENSGSVGDGVVDQATASDANEGSAMSEAFMKAGIVASVSLAGTSLVADVDDQGVTAAPEEEVPATVEEAVVWESDDEALPAIVNPEEERVHVPEQQ